MEAGRQLLGFLNCANRDVFYPLMLGGSNVPRMN